jgi:hypothetical protein
MRFAIHRTGIAPILLFALKKVSSSWPLPTEWRDEVSEECVRSR